MVFIDTDGKIIPDGVSRKGEDLDAVSIDIRSQSHKPPDHLFHVNRFIYPGTVLIDQDTVPLVKIVSDFRIENIFDLLLMACCRRNDHSIIRVKEYQIQS